MTNPIVDMPRNPNLRLWARAFAQREQRLPTVLVLSDSLAEAMGNTGPLPAWPYRLFAQQRIYIPAHSTWANGDNTWDAGILSGGAVVNTYPSGNTIYQHYVPLTAGTNEVTMDISGLSNVRPLWWEPSGWSWPTFSVDSSAFADAASVAWSGSIRISTFPIPSGNEVRIRREPTEPGTTLFAGVIADVGIPQAQVVNLSRSGAEARDWNSWLTPGDPAVQPTLSDLVSGSAADLVCIGVGGNDYWAGRTAAQYTTSLTSLITRVRAMLPSASICLNTQPPGNPGVTPNWDTIQNATVAVATSQNCALIEWRENFPIPNNGAGLYASDGIHFTDAGSLLCRDIGAPIILPWN